MDVHYHSSALLSPVNDKSASGRDWRATCLSRFLPAPGSIGAPRHEHAANEVPMVLSHLQAAVGGTAHPIVRPPGRRCVIKRFLDVGVQTFLIPYGQNADEAKKAVARRAIHARSSRFAPPPEHLGLGIKATTRELRKKLCLVQLKPAPRSTTSKQIAACDGVDGVFIGPGDLSADLGYVGQPNHPEVQSIIEATINHSCVWLAPEPHR